MLSTVSKRLILLLFLMVVPWSAYAEEQSPLVECVKQDLTSCFPTDADENMEMGDSELSSQAKDCLENQVATCNSQQTDAATESCQTCMTNISEGIGDEIGNCLKQQRATMANLRHSPHNPNADYCMLEAHKLIEQRLLNCNQNACSSTQQSLLDATDE